MFSDIVLRLSVYRLSSLTITNPAYFSAAVLKPRQMVIVHGTPDSSRHLAEFCRDSKDMGVSQIFVPGIGETVDATSERHIYQVRQRKNIIDITFFLSK